MKKPSEYVCDICGKKIEFEDTWFALIKSREHYSVKLITCDMALGEKQRPKKHKIDICRPCYRKMAEWIKTQRKESACES